MSSLHVVATIVFTLAVDIFALWRLLRWPWVRAIGVGVLINVASLVGAAVAYDMVAGRLPLEWTQLHLWVKYHAWIKVLFFAVAYGVIVLVEYLIVRVWEKEGSVWRVFGVVAGMNALTTIPGAIESAMAGWPRVPTSFTLERTASWAAGSDARLYYFDYAARKLMTKQMSEGTGELVSAALPVNGYRVGAEGRVCIASVTNTLVMSWPSATGRHEVTVPLLVTNLALVECDPRGRWYATADARQVRIYALPDNTLTASASVGEVEYLTAVTSGGVMWKERQSSGILTLGGVTNAVTAPEPFWYWSPYEIPEGTAVFARGDVCITVRNGLGIEIMTPTYTDTFAVVRGARYRGLDFTPDGRVFVFTVGSEVLALEIATRRVGHVCLGVGPVLITERSKRP